MPVVPLLIVGGIILLKAIDYGWTAWDAYQSAQVLADPHAGAADKAAATANLALTVATEAAEPDDLLPVSLPLDDLARAGIIGGLGKAGRSSVREWQVGEYAKLTRKSQGDRFEIHHVPQAHPAEQVIPGYNRYEAPAIAVSKDIHKKFLNPRNIRGPYTGTARDLVNKGLNDLREAGAPEKAIKQLNKLINRKYGQHLRKE